MNDSDLVDQLKRLNLAKLDQADAEFVLMLTKRAGPLLAAGERERAARLVERYGRTT